MTKPCPFCGHGEGGMYSAWGAFHFNCWGCGASGATESTEAEAIAAWNRRAEIEECAMVAFNECADVVEAMHIRDAIRALARKP